MNSPLSRRSAISKVVGFTAVATISNLLPRFARAESTPPAKFKGNINHCACRSCFGKMPLEEVCKAAKELGIVGLDLLNPPDFETVKKSGLVCSMVGFPTVDGLGGIAKAFNRVEYHDKLVSAYEQRINETAGAGFERVICFAGNRAGLADEQGLENCAIGLKRLMSLAERRKVTVCMELLNSKRNHKDYQCDHSAWGVELVKRVGSERFKLLYDIFHMQIMEGDICDTIKESGQYFGHYHTAGVPGRHEIDDSQELHYPAIMRAIVATGFKGFVAQEFNPKNPDRVAALRQAIQICDV